VGVFGGPKVESDGLVLALDGGNLKSFKGGADTNLLYNISNTYGNPTDQTYFKVSYGDTEELIPELGYRTVRYCNIFNDYPNSGDCCPSPLRYGGNVLGQSITVSPSTTYTYQIIYKVKSGYTNGNYMYRYEYNGGTYVTEGGVHSTNNRTSLGNDWWFAWGQFTTQSTTNNLWMVGMWYYQYNVYDTIYVASVSLHQGSHIIPAKFMLTPQENRGTTVATGGGWADLTGNGNHGELVNGVRESADNLGSLSFDGTNDVVNGNTTAIDRSNGQEITVSCWIKPSRTSGQYSVFCTNRSNNASLYNWIFYQHTTDGAISFHGAAQYKSSYVPTINVWINVTNTVTSSGVSTLYINGVSTYVVTGYSYGNSTSIGRLGIGADPGGQEPFLGNIAQVKIYNRALTANEVKQNFNATRGRFGI